ncbi:dermonecrotic toxin domain-containing protein [Pseudomonas sp. NPDC089734]|uniref:dermonecrotic toxin domain-containing protein n=1 Tax=Pseudomonas sp. NPDC089734 TaxID=3364469 RepID=UPI0038259526
MQTLTPVPASGDHRQPAAAAALNRLDQSRMTLSLELDALPKVEIPPDREAGRGLSEPEIQDLLQRIDRYWAAPSAHGQSRYDLFVHSLQQAMHDELTLKVYERDIAPEYSACLPLGNMPSPAARPSLQGVMTSSLHVELNEQTLVEIKGALAMSIDDGLTLLHLPGAGLASFASRGALFETMTRWLNDPLLRNALFNNADQRYRDKVLEVINDPDLFLAPFNVTDVQLRPVPGNPFLYALNRQLDKQRQDVRYASEAPLENASQDRAQKIQKAIDMPDLFGPAAMLERREQARLESSHRARLPYWIKIASAEDVTDYVERVNRYDEARAALLSTLGGAQSPEHFAWEYLKARLASDLGYDLNPDEVMVTTFRPLPLTGETYKITRSLQQLALYGLHNGDREEGSAFMTQTALHAGKTRLEHTHAQLTPAYMARLVDEADLRLNFAEYQRRILAGEHTRQLMGEMIRRQITSEGYAAKMQGHISPEDFTLVETAAEPMPARSGSTLKVQQIRLKGCGTLGKILVFRKEAPNGQPERLVMFASDVPRKEHFQSFYNETQLHNELLSWSAPPGMRDYLVQQVEAPYRPAFRQKLEELARLPYPESDFIQWVTLQDYAAGLEAFVSEHVRIALAEQAQHTPSWYREASAGQRQELLALEDSLTGALRNYEAHSHTHVESFEAYTHKRASQQIARLLGVPAGSVDPDHIIVTSQRETQSYTQMLLKGYDDGIDFINTSADTETSFSGPGGIDLKRLSPATVAASVRGQWLADDYIAHVRSTLLDPLSSGYAYRRTASLLMTQLQMKAAALRSLLKGHITDRQYQWLRSSLDHAHLSDAETRKRYPLYPLQIHVDKPFIASRLKQIDQLVIPGTALINVETVQGCIVILPTEIRHASLLYTPQAPDGIEFRLFSSFIDSLESPGMIDYYKNRCRVVARRTLSFFLRDMKEGNANKAPFIPREAISDFAQTCFNRPLERKLRDVKETTTGRNDMLSKMIWNSIEIVAIVLTLPFPPASFAVGAVLSMRDSMLAIQALTGETPESASAHLLASLLNSLGAAGDLHSGLKGFGGFMRKLTPRDGPTPLLNKTSRPPSYDELFPVDLQNETFWIGKPNANGHAPVFSRNNAAPHDVQITGQYATKNHAGVWHPLEQPGQDRAVNISLQGVPVIESGHAKGIRVVKGESYIELQGRAYQVQYDARMHCWNIVDPDKPFAFFGKQPVRLDEQGQWQRIDRLRLSGGGLDGQGRFRPLQEEAASANTPSVNTSDYELPQSMQPHLFHILDPKPVGSDWMGIEDFFNAYYATMRKTYTTLRENLYRDAKVFFNKTALPARPALPQVGLLTDVETFFADVFAKNNGLVLSEAPRSVASKRLLILNMPLLVEQKVEVLYIEHLFTDKHVQKLAKYRDLGKQTRSGSHELKEHLEWLNEGALNNQTTEYDYYHLIKAAHQHNIEVRPFSSSISYPVTGHAVASAAGDSTATQKMSKFFGHKVISDDIERNASRRWIALLDQKLANTYQNVPGIAELEGVISVRIQDAAANRLPRIKADPGTYKVDGQMLKSDFVLESGNPLIAHSPIPVVPAREIDYRLFKQLKYETEATDVSYYAGEHGFHWDNASGWKRADSESWAVEPPLTAIQQSLMDTTYEMPAATRRTMHDLINFEHKGVNEYYYLHNPEHNVVRQNFFRRRRQLQTDAHDVISRTLPPRPTLPVIPDASSPSELLELLYRHTDGVVIGESHAAIVSKKLIIDNLPLLKRNDVKTLYMEHLMTDMHQADLDRFFETGQMSKSLLHDLRVMDSGHRTDPNLTYNFEKLVIRAREHGIEVRAIDCSTSYRLDGLHLETSTTRQEMMNFFASRTINRHQEVIGTHKWIALVGNSHSNTFENVVPGIAELQGGIGLRVVEVPPGQARPLGFDTGGHVRAQIGREEYFLKGDYLVEMELPTIPAMSVEVELLTAGRLRRPGMFLIEQGRDGQQIIVHRSRDGALYRTPVMTDPNGKLYVDRPTWPLHQRPHDDMEALIQSLESMNMRQWT